MLYSQIVDHTPQNEPRTLPIPVFLHGFLGSSQDWADSLEHLHCDAAIQVDLPCHGGSKYCEVEDFVQACQQVELTILSKLKKAGIDTSTPLVLIGYSLGARVTMYGLAESAFPQLNICGAVLEGGNFGLKTEEDKVLRWENDKHWSRRFATEAIDEVLEDWYQQGVFASLTATQRAELVELRSDNLGSQLGCMLRATSLAKQPYLLDTLKQLPIPLLYICGEKDDKFQSLAKQSGLTYHSVSQAGHNVHHEQPAKFAAIVAEFIHQFHPSSK
ncbi:2-succinyl-6-hydroxy-2,4-cyclohexadiene-1-carboxylate synthase [Vibrio gangliei]|uniref:2-succinyl-6-hydroxy-2, 4-cyclohexadiene-1-carboxylate synthase n=1 Tax=Vibrio gangliei TaxID=2077090 RepID=UPI000D0125E4|nr:2-succinyl-6-hydroxy-2,4-cyclohexadiene-1-carboxylate synthase [Vibrio gangliei]